MQKLLKQWLNAVASAEVYTAQAFCATPAARARALHYARRAERRATEIARILRNKYGVDPNELLRRGEIK